MPDHALLSNSFSNSFREFCDAAALPWVCVDAKGHLRAINDTAAMLFGVQDPSARVSLVPTYLLCTLATLPVGACRSMGKHEFNIGDASVSLNVLAARTMVGELELMLEAGNSTSMRGELESLREQYQTLMDNSQNGVFIVRKGLLVYVNRALAEMLAYDPSEVIGMPGSAFVVEADLPLAQRIMNEPWQMGESRDVMLRLRMKHDMGIRDVSLRKICIEHDGKKALVGTVYDVTDLRRGEAALRDYATRLRTLSQQVIEIQENERRNLARELHDEIGQQLTLLKLSLEQARVDPDQRIEDAIAITSELTSQVRSLSLDLRPSMLDDLGIGATIRWYASRAAKLGALKISVNVEPDFPRLQPELETLYFRVAQEAITNALRHSGAETLDIDLRSSTHDLEMTIADDGCGFDLEAARSAALRGGSAGLLGMQERAVLAGASLTIRSRPNAGTIVRLVVPSRRATLRMNSA